MPNSSNAVYVTANKYLDLSVEIADVVIIEGEVTTKQSIQHHPHGPDVCCST